MESPLKRFLEAQNRLVIQSSDLSLESLATMAETGSIDISPKYQRRERWSIVKQSALIESFLLNIPVPPIYLAEDEYGKYSVIDGKQRITAITNFIKKDLKLSELEKFKEIEGLTFEGLPEQLRNSLSIRPYLRVVTLLKQSDPQLKYEVFTRLNTGGEKLLPQEIRNVAYRGLYNDMIFELAKNNFLRKQLKIKNEKSKAYYEMIDAEYVLRFFTINEMWDNFPGNIRVAMDKHMQNHRLDKKPQVDKSEKLFIECIEIAERIWGPNAFKKPGPKSKDLIMQGVYDVQMVPFSLLTKHQLNKVNHHIVKIRSSFLKLYENDSKFQESIRQFTSNAERVRYRISTMKNMLLEAIK